MMMILYHTAGCHLCEEAEALVRNCLAIQGIANDCLSLIEIAEQAELLERYGLLIPVLRAETSGRELNWPFTSDDVRQLLPG